MPVTADRTTLAPDEAIRFIDENTIAVVAILGSTYTGEMSRSRRSTTRWPRSTTATAGKCRSTSMRPAAASSRRSSNPDLNWDFRLPLVKSINVSGHKYGLVYPGIGWVVWRDRADLPEDLIFHISYLGGDEATFNLNFSKGASQVIAQYYNFLRLGREGYRRIMTNLRFDGRLPGRSPGRDRPVHPAGRPALAPPGRLPAHGAATLHGLRHLRTPPAHGWIVPAYHLPANAEEVGAAACRGPRGLQPRHGRHAPRRPDPGA